MLGEHPITPVLLATDLAAAREFYHDKLGLQIERQNENAIVFRCGSGTHLDVTKSTVGTAGQQTQAAWQVSDIRAELADHRARGVKVEDYDTPGLKTEDGIADIGFAWAAWIIDPATNTLGILQIKE
jgi:catechol 2,3-dioxygenase-like lactoylglutathione lyase family enzyme